MVNGAPAESGASVRSRFPRPDARWAHARGPFSHAPGAAASVTHATLKPRRETGKIAIRPTSVIDSTCQFFVRICQHPFSHETPSSGSANEIEEQISITERNNGQRAFHLKAEALHAAIDEERTLAEIKVGSAARSGSARPSPDCSPPC